MSKSKKFKNKDNKFKNEEAFLKNLVNIKRKRKKSEIDLYKELMTIIKNSIGDENKKDILVKLINGLDKNIDKLNPIAFVMEVNILLNKLIFIAKSKNKSVPSELLIPYISINIDPETWLNNLKDGVVPYLVNGELFNILKIKGLDND